tara:strand:+ start:609 stop:869 length:261 start_codon:yes stop_codon:yes gene_type:complete
MSAGSDALIEYTLSTGDSIFLNVNHIVSIAGNTGVKSLKQARQANTTLITVSSGEVFETVDKSVEKAVTDTRATIAKEKGLSGGKF